MMGMTLKKPALHVVEELQQASQDTARAVSDALPKIADRARQTGKQVADMAASATDRVADMAATASDRVASDPTVKAAAAAVLSPGNLQKAGRGMMRFARRRPALVILGGVALVSFVVAVSRRRKSAVERAEEGDGMGEGSYEGAKEYRDRTQDFLKSQGRKVTKLAKDAEKALDSGERSALEAAEEEGRRHARS